MRRLGVVIALGLALCLAASTVSAHSPGSPPITASGSFVLGRASGNNASFHAYISTLVIPPGPGDTLRFSWSANGGVGPAIDFNLHSHPANSTNISLNYATMYYDARADRVDDSWVVAGTGPYMVFWDNPNNVSETVAYSFGLVPPSPGLTLFLALPLILAVIVLLFSAARRPPHGPPSQDEPAEAI